MSEEKDNIEVAIDAKPETAKEQEIEVAQEDADQVQVPDTETALDDLKRQLESERNARATVEQQIRQAQNTLQRTAEEKRETEFQFLNGALNAVDQQLEVLKSNYAQALANGDHTQAAEINLEMSKATSARLQLTNGISAMKENPPPKVVPMPPPVDPVEALTSRLSPRSAQWVREHPEYARESRLTQKMIAAHQLAVADGMSPDTDDYFGYVERVLGVKNEPKTQKPQKNQQEEPVLSQAANPVKRAPPAAPVSRGNGADGRIVTLSKDEVEMASLMGMTKEEYAKNKQQLKKEGKMN